MTELPIASHPNPRRDQCRLLALNRVTAEVQYFRFHDILDFFKPGDCLALNISGVFPARILFEQEGKVGELLLQKIPQDGELILAKMQGRWAKRFQKGNKKIRFLKGGEGEIEVFGMNEVEGAYQVKVHSDKPLSSLGEIPLPPYILKAREAAGEARLEDADAQVYQTVYAKVYESLAAPTAGLHWTEPLLKELEVRGVSIARLILHLGFASTIRAVGATEIPEERYEVSVQTAKIINETRQKGGRVFACGTSVVRTLETVCDDSGKIAAGQGATKLFIKEGHKFRAFDALITNFHIPDSTHFMLTQAYAGKNVDLAVIYEKAAVSGFRFFSYGDAMLLY